MFGCDVAVVPSDGSQGTGRTVTRDNTALFYPCIFYFFSDQICEANTAANYCTSIAQAKRYCINWIVRIVCKK